MPISKWELAAVGAAVGAVLFLIALGPEEEPPSPPVDPTPGKRALALICEDIKTARTQPKDPDWWAQYCLTGPPSGEWSLAAFCAGIKYPGDQQCLAWHLICDPDKSEEEER